MVGSLVAGLTLGVWMAYRLFVRHTHTQVSAACRALVADADADADAMEHAAELQLTLGRELLPQRHFPRGTLTASPQRKTRSRTTHGSSPSSSSATPSFDTASMVHAHGHNDNHHHHHQQQQQHQQEQQQRRRNRMAVSPHTTDTSTSLYDSDYDAVFSSPLRSPPATPSSSSSFSRLATHGPRPRTRITLFFNRKSRAVRTRWLLEELRLEYELVVVDTGDLEGNKPAFLDKYPFLSRHSLYEGKMPVLRDRTAKGREAVITQSVAINTYLCDHYARGRKYMVPAVPSQRRARYDMWLSYILTDLEAPLLQIWAYGSAAPDDMSMHGASLEREHPRQYTQVNHALARINTEFAENGNTYILGKHFSAADVTLCHVLCFVDDTPTSGHGLLYHFPLLTEYMRRLLQRPAAIKGMQGSGFRSQEAVSLQLQLLLPSPDRKEALPLSAYMTPIRHTSRTHARSHSPSRERPMLLASPIHMGKYTR
jgi:glutathione S-transferase